MYNSIVKTTFFVPLIFFAVLLWQPAVAQTSLPACTMSLPDHDNDDVAAAVDIDKDNDGLIEICDLEGLNEMRYQLNGSGYVTSADATTITQGCPDSGCIGYELVRSLDFADAGSYRNGVIDTAWTTSTGWQPIGSDTNRFSGIFEGNGHTISNLYINRIAEASLGLFSVVDTDGEVNNVGLLNVSVEGIESNIGGVVGLNYGRITNSYATGAVTGADENVGGLVGSNGGDITNSYATGAVTGNDDVGGLVGGNFRGSVTNSYATGAVTGAGDNVGGLAGSNEGDIMNSYATGAVTGNSEVGGLVGRSFRGSVTNSYATGAVTGNSEVGGLVGWSFRGSITNSYWNTQTSGLAISAGGDGVTSATTAQLQSPTAPGTTTTEVYYGWSSDDWDFGTSSQYPILKKSDGTLLSPTLRYGLSQLRLAKGHLSPDFISIIPNYIGSVVVDTNTIQLIPIAINANARIHITGRGTQEIASGATSDDIMLNEDGITTITIVVVTTGTSIEYNFNLRYYQYSGDVDIDNDGLIEIDNIEDLDAIRYQLDGTGYRKERTVPKITTGCPSTGCKGYELTKSLSFAEDSDWSPIALFSGIFEGNGYTISKLRINKPNANSVGFFSSITSGAKINNIGLLDIDIQGNSYVGGLVGFNYGRITNSYATGAVTGNDEVGGLVGSNDGDIMNSYATGGVTGNSRVGGLVGWNFRGGVTNSYATGAVTGNDNVGGLVGSNEGDIMNSYATGAATGNSGVGGLVGFNRSSVTNSYATGAVTGTGYVGGLVGWSFRGSVTNSYWNTQTSGLAISAGGDGVTSATTVQLQSPTAPGMTTTEVYYGWSSDDWDFGTSSQYPILKKSDGTLLSPTLRYGLSQLRLAKGHLSPDFISIIPNYIGSVVVDTNTIQLIPIAINANARIHITGRGTQEIASGATSDDIMLNEDGITTITIVVVTTGTSIEYNFNLRYYQYSGDVDIDNDGLIEIDNIEDLDAIRYQLDGTGYRTERTVPKITTGCPSTGCKGYELTKNLSFGEDSDWSPIALFSGIFEGNGYTISNLRINKPNTNSIGFFSSITSGAKINNIGLLDIDIQGDSRVGGLVGENDGRITNSYATGAVAGTSGEVGGLVGSNDGDIMNSYATGAVTGNNGIGGLVGINYFGSVTNSYATGAVTGNSRIGGLVGINYFGNITNSYATGAVAGNGNVGGLVGENDGRITNSYATGVVTGNHNVGGLVGINYFGGNITNSYWNTQTSGLAISAGGDGVTSATTVQLQSPTAPSTTTAQVYYSWSSDDWDFGTSSQYPILKKSDGTLLSPTLRYGLSQLRLAKGYLSPDFISIIPNYTGSVVVDTNTIQLIPIAINANARIHITGRGTQEIASGATSDDIMLNEDGITTITIVVMTAGISIEYNFNLRYYQYSADVDIDNDGLIEIDNIEDLNAIRYQPDGSGYRKEGTALKITTGCPSTGCKGYELTKSLSFAEDSDWSPIALFSGIFEGNGYTISKLRINKPNASNLGFFSSITSGAKINNIGLLDIDIQGDSRVGGLAGENYGRITNSYATGAVTGNDNEVGGLVGVNVGDITNSYAAGTVTGNDNEVGGLVGFNDFGGRITNSYTTGAVTGNGRIGGLAGVNGGSVTNSYATGAVTGTGDNVGGLVGVNSGSVTNSYATGAVTGTGDNVGGLVGFNDFGGSVTNSYWNTQTSGLATSAGGDGVTSAITAQLQSPTAPGTTTTEIYYGWSSDDWDFGDNRHYPALRHAHGDDLNACNPDITTPSAMLACAVPLPNQRDRNQGLTALFVLADGDDVTAQLIPTFFPLKSSYDTIIATTKTAVQLTLRPYAINDNVTITITDQDNADYFVGKPNGALSDPIMLSDSITLTLVVTDTIDEATVNTTYTFIIKRQDPLEVLEIMVNLESATNADGTINEASMASILFDVVGGVGSYRYEYKIIVGTEEILLSQSQPPVELTIPDNIVAIGSTQQTIELNIIVSDSGGQTFEYREALTIQKVDNGVADIVISRATSRTLIAMMGVDPDGAPDDSAYQWQWLGTDEAAEWMDLESATSTSYTIADEFLVAGNEFRVAVAYTDGQGYRYDALYSKTMRYDLLPRCALAIADRDGDDVDSSIDVDKDGDGLIEICDLEGLNEIRYQLDGSGYKPNENAINIMNGCPATGCRGYELVKDLDFNANASYRTISNKETWTMGGSWSPIGSSSNPFSSVFEGNGYTISNLLTFGNNNIGLFSVLHDDGKINNVGLLNVDIEGTGSRIGSMVGRSFGIIINSYATGAVNGSVVSGGLVGTNNGSIINSYATATVSGIESIGGLAGVSGRGLVGTGHGSIINSYATGAVTGRFSAIGGLVGQSHGSIINSYATGTVTGPSAIGGLVGTTGTSTVIIASYWDKTINASLMDSANAKATMELQNPTAPGTTKTEVYYGWNSADWDFGDNSHYPALRYAEGDSLNACLTEITLSSTALPCGILLPNQSGRNQGLAGVFFFADGKVAPTILTPLLSQLGYSYEMIIASGQNMQLRPYALNDNATIAISDHRDENYFSDANPNGALSDEIEWNRDATTLTVIVTDIVDGDPANTTYTFAVTRVMPLVVAEISVNPSGVVDEGSNMTIAFTVSGGKGEYEYAYALDGEPLSSPSQPSLSFTIPTTIVDDDRTTQTVEVNIIVNDDLQIIEHPLALIVRKIDNGDDFSLSSEVSQSRLSAIFAGTDADGDGVVSYQWQQLALGGEWSNIAAATTPTYHLPADIDGSIRYRVNVQHTDGQGYVTHYQQGPLRVGNLDNDDDGLIEIYYLEDVDTMRYQLDGSGYKTSLSAPASMHGCLELGCSGYELMRHLDFNNDADYSAISNKEVWTTETGWQPIGTRIDPFSGLFEGNGYTLSGLQINRSAAEIGLFSVLHADGEIKNVGLLEVNVQGDDNVGSLVGENNGSIINSYATGTVSGTGNIGGLVGQSSNAIISSFVNVAVSGSNVVGGLVGESVGSIANTYGAGTVSITDTADQALGGLVGSNGGSITNSYAFSRVMPGIESAAALQAGGLVGVTTGSASVINASYWDRTVNASLTMSAHAKTTAELQSPTEASGIYSDWSSADWDFGDNSHYPALRYASDDNLNACATDITTSSTMLPCGIALPNPSDSDRNKGLAGIFFFADGAPASVVLDPIFSQLIYNYDMSIVATDLDIQIRPYALHDNAAIAISKGDTHYFSDDRPNGALSDTMRLDDNEAITIVITDIIDETTINTIYTFVIERLLPVQVDVSLARLSVTVASATSDPGGAGFFSYQWQQQTLESGWIDIPDATTATYWLPADANSSIPYRVNIKYTDRDGNETIYPQGPFKASVDDDGDGLIDIYYLEDLNALRYQLDGRAYQLAADAEPIMRGCPETGCNGYELMRSLDFNVADSYQDNTVDTTWITSTGWQPIGSDTNRFSGLFEGNGHTIANLLIDREESNLGLFSVLHTNGRIQNIGLLDVDVEGTKDVISGLVSINYGVIINSYVTGEITGTEDLIGGLVGFSDGSIINSYATGTISGTNRVGGLVGSNNGDITNSYATGTVAGHVWVVGGLVGENDDDGSVTNSYATGAVTGYIRVGGLVGSNNGDITNSYATGAVTGDSRIGGLVGRSLRGSITNSYWDTQTSGLATSAGDDGVTSATTAQLQTPTAPGTTTTEVYYGWSSDDWDFGDNSHYPALRYARGDDLNACNPDITTSSAMLSCQVPLPNQRDRNQGLTALFVLADGDDVTAEHIPTFFPLKSNYDTIIVTNETAVQLTLRPYAINNNATITITDQDNADYFVGKPNGALSDPIMLSDSITLTLVVTDTIDEATVNTTYTFVIRREEDPLEVLEITVNLESATNADGTINEGSHTTITYTVSGGSGVYEYAHKIDDGALTQSSASFVYRAPFNLVASDATTQAVSITIRVSDQDESVEVLEHREVLTIRKVNNGVAELVVSRETTRTMTITVGSDVDGDPDPTGYNYQWQSRALVTNSVWMSIPGENDTSYTISDDLASTSGEFRVQVMYDDGQGYSESPISNAISYIPTSELQPLMVSDIELSIQPSANADGTIDEGSTATLTFEVSGGTDDYQYASKIDDAEYTSFEPPFMYSIADDFIAADTTSQMVTLTIRVSDQSAEIEDFEHTEELHIRKTNNGSADINLSITNTTLTAIVGADPDGDPDPNGYNYQWQSRALGTDSEPTDIMSATDATYTIPKDVSGEFRVQVTYTDGQGYGETLSSDVIEYIAPSQGIKIRAKVFLEGPLR